MLMAWPGNDFHIPGHEPSGRPPPPTLLRTIARPRRSLPMRDGRRHPVLVTQDPLTCRSPVPLCGRDCEGRDQSGSAIFRATACSVIHRLGYAAACRRVCIATTFFSFVFISSPLTWRLRVPRTRSRNGGCLATAKRHARACHSITRVIQRNCDAYDLRQLPP